MNYSLLPTRITRVVTRILMILLVAMVFAVPLLLNWYAEFRFLTEAGWWTICITFFICAAVTAPALFWIDRLLGNILRGQVFTTRNVGLLRGVRWCCGIISLLCVIPGVIYRPLLLMVVIMGFLCFILTVVVQVMKAAVAMREENDLTI